MKIGYARFSTKERSFDLQIDELKKAGCNKICKEIFSGSWAGRQELNDLLPNALIVPTPCNNGRISNCMSAWMNDAAKQISFQDEMGWMI